MLIYGIRCDKKVLTALPHDTVADYYMNYGMLVFPSYSRPTVLDAKGRLTPLFWETMRLIIQNPTQVYAMDLEQPFITDAEAAIVKIIQASGSATEQPDWYHVPFIVTPETAPQLVVAPI
jgi:hypothetical protein